MGQAGLAAHGRFDGGAEFGAAQRISFLYDTGLNTSARTSRSFFSTKSVVISAAA